VFPSSGFEMDRDGVKGKYGTWKGGGKRRRKEERKGKERKGKEKDISTDTHRYIFSACSNWSADKLEQIAKIGALFLY
jgi:hypothetical protein